MAHADARLALSGSLAASPRKARRRLKGATRGDMEGAGQSDMTPRAPGARLCCRRRERRDAQRRAREAGASRFGDCPARWRKKRKSQQPAAFTATTCDGHTWPYLAVHKLSKDTRRQCRGSAVRRRDVPFASALDPLNGRARAPVNVFRLREVPQLEGERWLLAQRCGGKARSFAWFLSLTTSHYTQIHPQNPFFFFRKTSLGMLAKFEKRL